ncbi:flagellar assembly protein FliH [Halomonas sp. PAMB 3264]|uniref:flagellar assembly protein FliH n=1 Tax=Halomonas sp. PAMB 3264 TaxID=3075222 RepID=UPI00289A1570|nr:flagellar assembly protein FliH [Halomonas sp. PAMB 3264]WNL42189.1 flagellar assembly protein FliH [Halomonas sp. PAMB 3264]
MSNSSTSEFDRHGQWQRWQMDELKHDAFGADNESGAPSPHQRRVAAAQKAAEQARLREQQERDELFARVRQDAEQQGFDAGLAKGHAEGFEQGMKEAREQAQKTLDEQIHQVVAPMEALAKQFDSALSRLDDTIADDLVELAMLVGRQLALDTLNDRPEQVLKLVRELLHTEPPLNGQQRLWLNPEDHVLVEEHLGSELSAANWKLQPDDQLARGGCRVTSAQGELDATFESRWQAVTAQMRKRHKPDTPSQDNA